jgi:hypothetical protein
MRTGWLSWVRANDKTIIDMLESQGANLVKATSSLVELLMYFDALTDRKSKIKDLEHEGDKITHAIFAITSQTFVTPLDREDISRLTTGIDQIVNYVQDTGLYGSLSSARLCSCFWSCDWYNVLFTKLKTTISQRVIRKATDWFLNIFFADTWRK